jgi:hypothetical protein
MPRSSRLTAYPDQNAQTATRAPSRESGFVLGRKAAIESWNLRIILNVTQRQRQWGGKVIALFYHCSVCRSRSHYLSVCPTGRSKRLAAFQSAIKTFPSIMDKRSSKFHHLETTPISGPFDQCLRRAEGPVWVDGCLVRQIGSSGWKAQIRWDDCNYRGVATPGRWERGLCGAWLAVSGFNSTITRLK